MSLYYTLSVYNTSIVVHNLINTEVKLPKQLKQESRVKIGAVNTVKAWGKTMPFLKPEGHHGRGQQTTTTKNNVSLRMSTISSQMRPVGQSHHR